MYLESKTMEIKGDLDWVQSLLKVGVPTNEKIHNLAGVLCALEGCEVTTEQGAYDFGRSNPTKRTVSVKLREVVLVKSAEVVAAEEAVRRAQESLKAAEEVLDKVKKEN